MPLFRRFVNLWRRRSLDREFDEELQFHLEMRRNANLHAGMSPRDAEAEAHRHLGSVLRAKEGMHDARALTWMRDLPTDARGGIRLLRREPGITALAVVMLSLGIGTNVVVFSLIHGLLFRPMPFPQPERLVEIVDGFRTTGSASIGPTVPELLDLRARTASLENLSFYDLRDMQIDGGREPARVLAARVDARLLPLFGAHAQRGRLFAADENAPDKSDVVVLSNGLWQRNFGGDGSIVGRRIMINGVPCTVIGILAPDFSLDELTRQAFDLYVPFPMSPAYASRNGDFANVRRVAAFARLRADSNNALASSELAAFSHTLIDTFPNLYRRGSDGQDLGFSIGARPIREAFMANTRPALSLLAAAAGLMLLIACVNMAQFMTAQGMERRSEVAIRSSLGAARSRLVRQFLTEALIVGALSGVLGLVEAASLKRVLVSTIPPTAPGLVTVSIDGTAATVTIVLVVVTVFAFGTLPAWRFSSLAPAHQLDAQRTTTARGRTRNVLIAFEVSVAALLLVCAGLVSNSLRQRLNAPTGYSDADVTTMEMRISGSASSLGHTGIAYQRYLEQVTAIPGISAAAIASPPLPGAPSVEFVVDSGSDDAATLSRQQATFQIVSPAYFSVLKIPIKEGRPFASQDSVGHPPVAIVNEELARRFWPHGDAVGHRIRTVAGPRSADMTVIGVVGNVHMPVLPPPAVPQIYVSYQQQSEPSVTLMIRTRSGATVSADAVKRALWSIAPDQPIYGIRRLSDAVADATTRPKRITQLLGVFAALALVTSVVGVYTVVAYVVSRRSKEVALRLVIGAHPWDVLALFSKQTLGWTATGLGIGIAAAILASGALRAAVDGMGELDVSTLVTIVVAYLSVVATATSVPVLRALRVDPATVLRAE